MLHLVYPRSLIPARERAADVLFISGVGTSKPQDWLDASGNWLEKLHHDLGGQVQILSYEYSAVKATKGSVLRQLIAEGHTLLACLDDFCAKKEPERRHLFFVCHSLGGIVLKKTICLLRERFFLHAHVFDVLAGVLFLGTPHLPPKFGQEKDIVELILRSTQKRPFSPGALISNEDNAILSDLSDEFTRTGIQVPILSCHETKESEVHRNIFARFRKPLSVTIVSRELCEIGSLKEKIIGVHAVHKDLCNIPTDGDLYPLICGTLREVVNNRATLAETLPTNIPPGLEGLTLRSRSSHDHTGARPASEQRTRGMAQAQRRTGSHENSGDAVRGSTTEASMEIVYRPVSFEPVKKNPRLPCFVVRTHEKNPAFFGRAAILQNIDRVLLPDDARSLSSSQDNHSPGGSSEAPLRSFALCGLGGAGKTHIAIEYVYTRKSKYDAVFWVSADDRNILTDEFARIAVDLGLMDQSEAMDLPAACDRVKGWLSNPVRNYETTDVREREASWLLVFDNVDNLEVLDEFWPKEGIGAVLVTSRDIKAKSQMYSVDTGLDVPPFDIDEASLFIKTLTPGSSVAGQDGYISQIAARTGGLPLLISQIPGIMARLRLSYKDFLRMCDDSGIEVFGRSEGKDINMSTQYFSVFSKIGLDGLEPEALGLLQMISMLDPDRIPERILFNAWSKAPVNEFPGTMKDYFKARAQLLQSSLVSHNADTEEMWLHRIVQTVVRESMDEARLTNMLEYTVHAISNVWPFGELVDRFSTDRYEICADLFPSVVRLKTAQKALASSQPYGNPDASAELLNDAGWYWFERGNPEEAKDFFRLTEHLYQRSIYQVTEKRAYMLRRANLNQATASMETNDRDDCLFRYRKWLDESQKLPPPDPDDAEFGYEFACIYNEMGVAYAMNEKFDLATEYFILSIRKFQELPNYTDTMLNWPEPNLGFMYWIQGQHEEAERVLLEILDVHETEYGVDDTVSFKTGKILYALGNVYASQGHFDESLIFHTRCLRQYQKTLGNGHHRVGDVSHRLADHNIRLRNFGEAEKFVNQALKIFASRPYYKNEFTRTTYKKAQLLQAMGQEQKATEQFRTAFQLRRSLLPKDGRSGDELSEADYDSLVIFWSR